MPPLSVTRPRVPATAVARPPLRIVRIYLSSGHNFFGRYGQQPGTHPLVEVDAVECVEGRGLKGDRFFGYRPDYKGQVTLLSREVCQQLQDALGLAKLDPGALRRNLLVEGMDLNLLVGTRFQLQDVELEGVEECRPCPWMNGAVGQGAEDWLRGRGGLRCRVLKGGWIRREES